MRLMVQKSSNTQYFLNLVSSRPLPMFNRDLTILGYVYRNWYLDWGHCGFTNAMKSFQSEAKPRVVVSFSVFLYGHNDRNQAFNLYFIFIKQNQWLMNKCYQGKCSKMSQTYRESGIHGARWRDCLCLITSIANTVMSHQVFSTLSLSHTLHKNKQK